MSGSPPVRRILSMPSGTATLTNAVISSKVRSSARSRKVTSSGMQYVQRRLQRSVTLIRRLLCTRPKVSISWLLTRFSFLFAMDPFGAAVSPVFPFPDRHEFLEAFNGEAASLKGFRPMRATDRHSDTHFPDLQVTESMHHGHFTDRPALTGLLFNFRKLLFGHAGVGFVIEGDGLPAVGQVAHGSQKRDQRSASWPPNHFREGCM